MRPAEPRITSLRIDWLSQTNFPLECRSAHDVAAGNVIIIGDGYYTGRVTPRKLVGHLRGRSWHERDAFAGRPKNVLVVPVVSSFVWIAAACCCAMRRRRQQRRLSGKGI